MATDQCNIPRSGGRLCEPNINLNDEDEEDLPEFDRFDDESESDDIARAHAPAGEPLSVESVDMCLKINRQNHHTDAYDNQLQLVVRRGQEFVIQVTFSRPLTPADDYQIEFLIGSNPSASRGSLLVVTFGDRPGCAWRGRIVEKQGSVVLLGIQPTPNAIVGKFRTYVCVVGRRGMHRTKRNLTTDFYLLFNAWCPEDAVYLPDEAARREYVMNDCGIIYQGEARAVSQRSWMFGQFEQGVLDACICILDASRMPISNRGNAIKLIRKGSAMINSHDDNGVLVGNWSDDYSMGTSPTLWTGSVKILLQYASTGVPVSFAQCWVYAGVFNTFLRCLGLPARVITNFSSAHDNTGNLKTDLIFKPDGSPDRRRTRDSIWNYHCWNEVFMTRPDLPVGLGGWQVVDATPQETSDGHYRCGPASVNAIKEGLLCHQFDAGFVFAEVNSDVMFLKCDRYGILTPFRVDKTHIGQVLLTKAIESDMPADVTQNYKYPEGSASDERTMNRAEDYGCERDHTPMPISQLSVTIHIDQVSLGQDFSLMVDFQNKGSLICSVQAHLAGSVIFYTGVETSPFKNNPLSVTVQPYQTERVVVRVTASEYMVHLGSQNSLRFVLTGHSGDQSLSAIRVVTLQTPTLIVTVSGVAKIGREMFATVTFTNPFSYALENVYLAMEGPGLLYYASRKYSLIPPMASITWTESFIPRILGSRRLIAALDCSLLRQVWGTVDLIVI